MPNWERNKVRVIREVDLVPRSETGLGLASNTQLGNN